ncbi:MAG: hypothetical protein COB02_10575 [Candidatus Cloacimonadota bacterium]|nr:MAG: hypothetical protein COB02_10575 [Candidatus Cloacimonadota bacterium]
MMQWQHKDLKPAIISIGDEILFGEIENNNAYWIQKKFFALGIPFQKSISIGDDILLISNEIKSLKNQGYFPIITTGGLGGTHDDVSREGIAKALDLDYCIHQECLKKLHELYKLEITDQRKRMAILPKNCDLIENPLGAPGFYINGVYALPGFPQMFQAMVQNILDQSLHSTHIKSITQSCLYNTTEGVIAIDVENFSKKFPLVNVGIYGNIDSSLRQTTVKIRYNDTHNINDKTIESFFLEIANKYQIEYQII